MRSHMAAYRLGRRSGRSMPKFAIVKMTVSQLPNLPETWWSLLQLLGACLLIAVILAHVAEAFGLFPSMGWGRPDTIGHYIDLVSALGGSILLPTGYIARRVRAKRF